MARLRITVIALILLVSATAIYVLWSWRSVNPCAEMLKALNRSVDPQELQDAAAIFLSEPSHRTRQRLAYNDLPSPIVKVMRELKLDDAAIATDSATGIPCLVLANAGGFSSYGVKIVNPGFSLGSFTNNQGLRQQRWTNSIYVFFYVP
jgi:hypothetical protein